MNSPFLEREIPPHSPTPAKQLPAGFYPVNRTKDDTY